MISDKRRQEIAESLRRLAANYGRSMTEFEEALAVLCRKLELDEISVPRPDRSQWRADRRAEARLTDVVVDRATFTVRWHGRSCFLGSSLPFRLFERLSRRPNQFVSYEQLYDEVWFAQRSREAVRSVVKVLRQKLIRAGMRGLAQAIDGRTRDHYMLVR
jgi:DNA-binding response OmpR family regulator